MRKLSHLLIVFPSLLLVFNSLYPVIAYADNQADYPDYYFSSEGSPPDYSNGYYSSENNQYYPDDNGNTGCYGEECNPIYQPQGEPPTEPAPPPPEAPSLTLPPEQPSEQPQEPPLTPNPVTGGSLNATEGQINNPYQNNESPPTDTGVGLEGNGVPQAPSPEQPTEPAPPPPEAPSLTLPPEQPSTTNPGPEGEPSGVSPQETPTTSEAPCYGEECLPLYQPQGESSVTSEGQQFNEANQNLPTGGEPSPQPLIPVDQGQQGQGAQTPTPTNPIIEGLEPSPEPSVGSLSEPSVPPLTISIPSSVSCKLTDPLSGACLDNAGFGNRVISSVTSAGSRLLFNATQLLFGNAENAQAASEAQLAAAANQAQVGQIYTPPALFANATDEQKVQLLDQFKKLGVTVSGDPNNFTITLPSGVGEVSPAITPSQLDSIVASMVGIDIPKVGATDTGPGGMIGAGGAPNKNPGTTPCPVDNPNCVPDRSGGLINTPCPVDNPNCVPDRSGGLINTPCPVDNPNCVPDKPGGVIASITNPVASIWDKLKGLFRRNQDQNELSTQPPSYVSDNSPSDKDLGDPIKPEDEVRLRRFFDDPETYNQAVDLSKQIFPKSPADHVVLLGTYLGNGSPGGLNPDEIKAAADQATAVLNSYYLNKENRIPQANLPSKEELDRAIDAQQSLRVTRREDNPIQSPDDLYRDILRAILDQKKNLNRIGATLPDVRDSLNVSDDFIQQQLDKKIPDNLKADSIAQLGNFRVSSNPQDFPDKYVGAITNHGDKYPITVNTGHPLVDCPTDLCGLLHEITHLTIAIGNDGSVDTKLANDLSIAKADANWEDSRKLEEGLAEWTARKQADLAGKTIPATLRTGEDRQISFPQHYIAWEVVRDQLIDQGLTKDQADATLLYTGRTGDFDYLFRQVGNGDKESGVKKVQGWFEKIPSPVIQNKVSEAVSSGKDSAVNSAVQQLGGKNSSASELPNLFSMILSLAYAADKKLPSMKSMEKVVTLTKLELVSKKNLAEKLLNSDRNLNSNEVRELLSTDIFQPKVNYYTNGIILTTGRTGSVKTEILPAQYTVDINSIPGTDIKIPEKVIINNKDLVIPVAIRKGTGKVEKLSLASYDRKDLKSRVIDLFNQVIDVIKEPYTSYLNIVPSVYAQSRSSKPFPISPKVTAVVFEDNNGNGRYDKGEKILPWAGVAIKLTRIHH